MPGKRVFFVCKSKNCAESKQAKTRCTISMMPSGNPHRVMVDELNERQLCLMYDHPFIVKCSNTPLWQLSPDKMGERTKRLKLKNVGSDLLVNNPDFLEVS